MKNSEKQEFLDFAQDLAQNLESVTDEFIEIQIGWMTGYFGDLSNRHLTMPVTIMVNHENRWFGDFEKLGWNSNVIYNNLKEFTPVPEDYLALNELINKAYRRN